MKEYRKLNGISFFEIDKGEGNPLVIMTHGIFGLKGKNSDPNVKIAGLLAEKDISVLCFDLNGHGDSDGEWKDFTFEEAQKDFRKMSEYARMNLRPSSIGTYGSCFGGLIALTVNDEIGAKCSAIKVLPIRLEEVIKSYGPKIDAMDMPPETKREIVDIANRSFEESKYILPLDSLPLLEETNVPTGLVYATGDFIGMTGLDNPDSILENISNPLISIMKIDHPDSRFEPAGSQAYQLFCKLTADYLDEHLRN